ncbi:MAG: GNAT family N-acetyltransferase [Pseudomonadales bacterium]|nr:GNAT family N-acetyltransferase [Pseudomonadales bacterium]
MNETNSIFEQPWWLDAIAPDHWQAVEVRMNGDLQARLPFTMKPGPLGMKVIAMPPLTQTLGPWLKPSNAGYSKHLSWQKSVLTQLIKQLPDFDYLALNLAPELTNWLPFHWQGFQQTTRYSYRLENLADLNKVWSGFQTKIRTDIRKAQKTVTIRDDLSLDKFWNVHCMTFQRQGKIPSYGKDLVARLHAACVAHGASKMFFAEDTQGRIHAVVYLIWDAKSAYYLLGGGDPALRNSGATSLALWEAIQFASTVTNAFDFEGSMVEPIERFFRGFGATQTPYFRIEKKASKRYRLYDAGQTLVNVLRRG